MSTCEGEFEIKLVEGDLRVVSTDEDCKRDAEWRVTYFSDTGMEPINCCDKCIMTTSVLSVMYSAVRLEKNK